MRRIGLIVVVAVGLGLVPLAAEAQATKVYRIGFPALQPFADLAPYVAALRQGLREHAYVEGQNLVIESRFADGSYDRLPSFAAELVGMKVDVIVTLSTEAALAAKKATASIPIVFTQVSDPIASGVVASLARPGGNLSGFSLIAVELTGKRLELFKEAVPSLKLAIIFCHRGSPVNALALKEAEVAAHKLGLEARLVEVRDADEIEPAFTTMARERAHGVVLVPSSFLVTHVFRITELATKRRLPVLGWTDLQARKGAFMSYGPSVSDVLRRAGGHVAKILNGAKPSDLPVEQPTKFELVINLKTAKALGLNIPQSVLLQADRIIEQLVLDQRGQLLRAAAGFAALSRPSYDHALWALRIWLDSWAGIGRIAVGMAHQGYDLQLTRYDERGWRATFYTTGMEHSPTSATGTGWERTPWHATQRAALKALMKVDPRLAAR